jgi:lipoate-protein ligase B
VVYPILNLKRLGVSVKAYVSALEETVIRSLAYFDVMGFRRTGKPGVWTGEQEKVASIGVRIRRRITYHGFSLNVSVPLDPCQWVISCGMPDVHMVSVAQYLDHPVSMKQVREAVAASISQVFNMPLRQASLQETLGCLVEEVT